MLTVHRLVLDVHGSDLHRNLRRGVDNQDVCSASVLLQRWLELVWSVDIVHMPRVECYNAVAYAGSDLGSVRVCFFVNQSDNQ